MVSGGKVCELVYDLVEVEDQKLENGLKYFLSGKVCVGEFS